MNSTALAQIIEYVWIPIVTALVMLWRRLSGMDTRTQLLEQADNHCNLRRNEDNTRFERDRRETLDTIEKQHKTVMKKLDEVDRRVKNGHG